MSTVRTLFFLGAFLSLQPVSNAVAATSANGYSQVHVARGSIKFVNSSTLVIHQISPYAGKNMTFVLRPTTDREGDLKVGAAVTVRYEDEPDHRITTVVEVADAKAPPSPAPAR